MEATRRRQLGALVLAESPLRNPDASLIVEALLEGIRASGLRVLPCQSQSMVAYLITTYGWEKMRELLAVFQEGSTQQDALLGVYSRDLSVLDREWRASLGLE